MKIAFLTPEFPHAATNASGGIGTSLAGLTKALVDEGHEVVLLIYGQNSDQVFQEGKIQIHLIKKRKYTALAWYRYRKFLQQYINHIVVTEKIDLIEAPDWTGITAFMHLKAPLVIRFHGSDAYFCHLEGRKQKFTNFLFEKLAIMNADAYLSPTDYAAKITRDIFRINKPIVAIPNGISLAQFNNDSPHSFEKGLILYVGTIIRKKGVLELPDIFRKVCDSFPNAKLMLVGSDSSDIKTSQNSTWKLIQSSLDTDIIDSFSYLGKISYSEVGALIKKANVCVFPSFAETQGMVTIEAMAMSKAIVNSNIGWSTELIEDGINGYLVHPKNHELFAEKIVNFLADDKLCLEMGKAARVRAEALFDIKKTVRMNTDFYKSVLKS